MTFLRRLRDFALVVGPRSYAGCRCPECMRVAYPPDPPGQPVTISRAAVDAVVLGAFGPMPGDSQL